ncbi:Hypothetical protein, putative [Bodo saltans]|uniref:Uncharacterized protein n=1 Tax=Bodo saltans TaxID=75058 RepID=A0A0S4JHL3_BODSA|nr:Hypothetical protein, putative [Bodo saltans]|eukprot:CUG88526.1 Hypothetical protein, putative [Bodo saltans]
MNQHQQADASGSSSSPLGQVVDPLEASSLIQFHTLSRKASRRRKPLHTANLQRAMNELASILAELRDLDTKELARKQAQEEEEGERNHDDPLHGAVGSGEEDPTIVVSSAGTSANSSTSSSEKDEESDAKSQSGTSNEDAAGHVMGYRAEVLREYNDEFPPLRTLRMRTNDAKHKRDAESQRQSASISLLGTSQWRHSKELEPPLLTQKDQRRVDLLKRRQWIEIPDDSHEIHCLLNGLDPWASTSRTPKTHHWFDNRPMYSPAVLLLAQVSQQQVTAMKKKHGRKGGKNMDALLPDGAVSPGGGKVGTLSLDPPLVDVYHPIPRLANAYFDNPVFPLCYNHSTTPKDVE